MQLLGESNSYKSAFTIKSFFKFIEALVEGPIKYEDKILFAVIE